MKEAAGEANLTVIAIVLIGVVAAVVTPLISGLLSGQAKRSCCQSLGGIYQSDGSCSGVSEDTINTCVNGGKEEQKTDTTESK